MAQFIDSLGPGTTPVVVSVPHAGRDYPVDIAAQLAVPLEAVRILEDRHVDLLARPLAMAGHCVLIARTPRLMIDLNRAECDIDPGSVAGVVAPGRILSPLARAGLGVVPHRLPGGAAIWRDRITASALRARIADVHRPYHAAVAAALARARRNFGYAILIDLHSMPPLPSGHDAVVGDRRGTSAGAALTVEAVAALEAGALRVAVNRPYQGGQIVAQHGAPARGIHALQIEIDRRCYLDPALDEPGQGLVPMIATIADLTSCLTRYRIDTPLTDAAE